MGKFCAKIFQKIFLVGTFEFAQAAKKISQIKKIVCYGGTFSTFLERQQK